MARKLTKAQIKKLVLNINKANADTLYDACKAESLDAGMTDEQARGKAFMFVVAAFLKKTVYN